MAVTEFGISMLVRPEQLLNAPVSIVVTEFGIVKFFRPEQLTNA